MNMNDFMNPLQDFYKQNKKKIFIGATCLIGFLMFIIVFSILTPIIDKATAVYVEVSFNTNGGTIINTQKVRKGKILDKNIKTEKVGFEFLGWKYKGEFINLDAQVTEDMMLTAEWQATGATIVHTVFFETYGGTTINPIEVSEGRTFTKPIDPNKACYQFLGWYVDEEPFNFLKTAVSNDITLKAKWERVNPLEQNPNELKRSEELFEQLSGTWYLKDYEDIYLTFTEENNGFTDTWYFLKWYNIDLLDGMKLYRLGNYQRTFSTEKVEFYHKIASFKFYLKDDNLIMRYNGTEYTFTRTQGSTNRYTNTMYENSVGRWFLENSYSSYIDITAEKVTDILDYDTYCIHTTNMNLGTLQLGSSMEYGCRKAYDDSLFKMLNIEFDNDVMTIRTENGTKRFTLNRVVEIGSVTGVKLDKISANLLNGNQMVLFATVMPKEANNTKVTWETSDASIVTVKGNPNVITSSAEGVRYSATITAHKAGKATITVKTQDGNHIATSKITVPEIKVDTISLNKKETTIYVGNYETLKATIYPLNASNQNLVWSSSDSDIAIVNSNGNVQGIKEGKATITVSTEDGSKKATCVVNVKYMTLKVITTMTYFKKSLNGEYANGIQINVNASGGSGIYSTYQIKLYYNHNLVKEGTESTLFYPTELKGNYYAEITVVDSEGHKSVTTKEYIKN